MAPGCPIWFWRVWPHNTRVVGAVMCLVRAKALIANESPAHLAFDTLP